MKYKKLKEILKNNFEIEDFVKNKIDKKEIVKITGNYEIVETFNDPDEFFMVYHFIDHNIFMKFKTSYNLDGSLLYQPSYDEYIEGFEFVDWDINTEEVKPQTKEKTEYKKQSNIEKEDKKLNFEEILKLLKNNYSIEDIAFENFELKDFKNLVGNHEIVARRGGEDKGSDWYIVYYFINHDIYMKIQGYYSSLFGVEFSDGWENAYEVKPQTKTITVYEQI